VADDNLIDLTADIVSAHVSNNKTAPGELPQLIQSVYAALSATANPVEEEVVKQEPAVPVRSSVKQDYIVCLEDGAKLKMLKRYLRTNYDMSPEEYRTKWGLPRDYPMVAPAYAEQRRTLAKAIGLGRKKAEEYLAEPSAVIPKARKAKAADAGDEAPKRGRGRSAKSKLEEPVQDETARG
jgi:predicted transcriptional regulator